MPHRRDDPRYLVFRHARRCRQAAAGIEPRLKPGEEHLHAFLMPGLPGGGHTVHVEQEVVANNTARNLVTEQRFYVDSPQFNLPEGEVHSVYPPSGHEERAECLPHVVLKTPTLPWEWTASKITDVPDYKGNRNRVPWLAVLVFTKEELQLVSEDLRGDKSVFQNIPALKNSATQTATLTVNMRVKDIKNLHHTTSPITDPDQAPETDSDVSTDVIFVSKALFNALFSEDDAEGESISASHPNVRPYRFLAHRRDINTDGMAVAALTADDNDQASYGVVFSHRTGPVNITEPTACIAHLVSIRGVEGMSWPASDEQFVALSSLHSWTYTGLPPDTPSVWDLFNALGQSSSMLQPPVTKNDLDPDAPADLKERVTQRLGNGYTLTRYRTQTGESTACFFRGPFIPVQIPLSDSQRWRSLSTSGQDLQILDQKLGLIDITYSAAWQLGRTLAIADQEFITRIGLVRKHIYDRGMELNQQQALRPHGVRSRPELLSNLPLIVSRLHQLPQTREIDTDQANVHTKRWFRPPVEPVDLSYRGRKAKIASINEKSVEEHFVEAAKEISSAAKADGDPSDVPYNEFNIPYSPDWMAVLKWVMNRLFLATIPPHYLIPESSSLPLESVRFFRIDHHWMDALVDGALSLANYRDQKTDLVRDAIWAAIKRYRETKIPDLGDCLPPVPEYGCYIRSTLLTKFPDLRVELDPPQAPPKPLVLLRHEIVSPDTMLCLFSHQPGSEFFKGMSLIQPPHQQTFVAATDLDQRTIKMSYKKAYTVHVDKPDGEPLDATKEWTRPQTASVVPVYRWDSSGVEVRRLLMENLSKDYLDTLLDKMPESLFKDDTPTSTLMATQLGSVCYQIVFSIPPGATTPTHPEIYNVGRIQRHLSIPNTKFNANIPPSPLTTTAYAR
ncbi:hypothetical protein BGW36DRAFT_440592 [Talaromyces proteolyticus]|uniref:Uncharacterized protein n=1 Tax=Talaromyces proteolyticus TaxID=1131652 RepID=A0AAD4PUX7_9EURO|nr:uncharacterized protein BGW36DRAFT_440592 [Talaromyces proteolyticus]KAH8689863.1 hypothetical protein BGW36DRAFT_440592 [Talaromyces proteolyticus]